MGLVEVVRKVVIDGKVGSGICSGLKPGTSLVSPWPLDSAAGPCPAEQALSPAGSGCELGLGPREASLPSLSSAWFVRKTYSALTLSSQDNRVLRAGPAALGL